MACSILHSIFSISGDPEQRGSARNSEYYRKYGNPHTGQAGTVSIDDLSCVNNPVPYSISLYLSVCLSVCLSASLSFSCSLSHSLIWDTLRELESQRGCISPSISL